MRAFQRFLLGSGALFLACSGLFAQVTGQLNGVVQDSTGASVPNAAVHVLLVGGSKALVDTATDSSGHFTIPTLRADTYDLLIEASGFTPSRVNTVRVDAATNTTLPPIELKVASTGVQTVDVSASASVVQTVGTDITSLITSQQLQNLPIIDRQITVPIITQAGVTGDRTVTTINGLRPQFTNLTLDGINVQDSVRTNDLDFQPNRLTIGQIAEMTLSTSNMDSTIGGNANSISLVTPSGTNIYRGNLYWYNRNSYLAANDWFSNQSGTARPQLNLNQLGGTIGGPIKRDKLLFFTNYEAYRKRAGSPRTLTILTPTARQGILRYGTNGSQQFDVLKSAGVGIDPYIQSLLAQVPTVGNTNTAGDGINTTGYTFNARGNSDRDNVTGKLDYYLTPRQSFSVSYLWNREVVDRPDNTASGTFYTAIPPIFNDNSSTLMSMSWRFNVSARITNELRGGFDRQTGAFSNRVDIPKYYVTGLNFSTPMTQNSPEVRKTNNYSIQDNANWVKGNHSMAFGFQAAPTRTTDINYQGIYASYGVGVNTANGFGFVTSQIPGSNATDVSRANALLASLGGLVSTAAETLNPTSRTSGYVAGAPFPSALNINNMAPYFRDNWRVRSNITLTLGLRWEYWGPVDVANGLLIQPKLINNNAPLTLLSNATLDFVPSPLYKRDLNNFAPNVGFAWNVGGTGKTSVRAAYGVSFANDNLINDITNSINAGNNNGLTTAVTLANLKGFANAPPGIPVPAFSIPRTSLDNFNISPSAPPAQGLIDPNLATPYVQQWNLSLQHEVKGFVVEGRYVGNHTVKQLRVIDYNQVDVTKGGFIQDYINARSNAQLALNATGVYAPSYNPAIAGSKPLPVFATFPSGGLLTNSTIISQIRSGEAGTLAQTYQTNGLTPAGFSFFPNPYALYSALLTNISNSTYNGLQVEVTKRMHNGMFIQGNYTFSKSLSDALATRGLEAQLDNANSKIEKARSPFDTTHSFKVNHYIPLPFKSGNRYANALIGGWGLSGFLRVETGPPVSILSARGTLNRGARSGNNTVDTSLTLEQLKGITGLFKTGDKVYFVDPSHIGSNGQGVAPDANPAFNGQVFFNPQPGSLGSLQRRILDGPGFTAYDVSALKTTRLTERQSLEFRADFYNVFNHPSFFVGDQNVNSSTFGQITGQNYTDYGVGPRLVQLGLMYRF